MPGLKEVTLSALPNLARVAIGAGMLNSVGELAIPGRQIRHLEGAD